MLDFDAVVGGKEPAFDDDADVDLARLAAKDRDAIMARVTPDDSAPPDAFALAQNEIRREMIDRGIQPKGFYNDDAARLQEEFNREHVAEKEARMQQRIQFAVKSYLRETVHRSERGRQEPAAGGLARPRQGQRDAQAGESAPQCHRHARTLQEPRVQPLAQPESEPPRRRRGQVHRTDAAPQHDAESSRAREQRLWPAICHGLCRRTARERGAAVPEPREQSTHRRREGFFGHRRAGGHARAHKTLLTLNLWRTRLGAEGGKHLAVGLEKNSTLLCVDIGNNRIATSDGLKTDQRVSKNRHAFAQREAQKIGFREAQLKAAEKERARQADLQKQAEYDQWVEERKLERQQDREAKEAERQRQLKLEEDRLRQLAARKAAEFAARAELDKKKKKKKKGGAKKKKE